MSPTSQDRNHLFNLYILWSRCIGFFWKYSKLNYEFQLKLLIENLGYQRAGSGHMSLTIQHFFLIKNFLMQTTNKRTCNTVINHYSWFTYLNHYLSKGRVQKKNIFLAMKSCKRLHHTLKFNQKIYNILHVCNSKFTYFLICKVNWTFVLYLF